MNYTLDVSHEKYIKIIVSGHIDKTSLVEAISEVMQHPDYVQKNTFWDCRSGSMGLTIGDLNEIVGILKSYKPKEKIIGNKSAIVVPGEMNKAMMEIFVTMSKWFPINFKIFTDIDKAIKFVFKC